MYITYYHKVIIRQISFYFFIPGNEYWRYDSNNDPPVSDRYPRPISNWKGLPLDGIDAAFQWENSRTYFFKGSKYYRFNDITFEVSSFLFFFIPKQKIVIDLNY